MYINFFFSPEKKNAKNILVCFYYKPQQRSHKQTEDAVTQKYKKLATRKKYFKSKPHTFIEQTGNAVIRKQMKAEKMSKSLSLFFMYSSG